MSTIETQVSRRRCTYVHWEHYFDSHPRTFDRFDAALVQRARSVGCLFARKVKVDQLTASDWRGVVGATSPAREPGSGTAGDKSTVTAPPQPPHSGAAAQFQQGSVRESSKHPRDQLPSSPTDDATTERPVKRSRPAQS